MQHSFSAGEWAPALNARVDLQKYHAGAALLRNFFVDYRGGASTRTGTKYILQCFKSATAVRLIPFQASFTVSYVLEFGDLYIRFYNNGAAVLETAIALTAATAASPAVFTKNAHGLQNGDWIFTSLFAGGTWSTINNKYYIVAARTANTFQLTTLAGVALNTPTLGTWSAGSVARVYTLTSPYTAAELPLLKYAQNVNILVICHPNHAPYVLTLVSAASWTLAAITFGPTVLPPTNVNSNTTLAAGLVSYAYRVTSVDAAGQESSGSLIATIANVQDIRAVNGTNYTQWTAAANAVSYNVYKAELTYGGLPPTGSQFGFIGNCTGTQFADSNIAPNYSLSAPLTSNPFSGSGVTSLTVTAGGSFTTLPTLALTAPPPGGVQAVAQPVMLADAITSIVTGGSAYLIGDTLTLPNSMSLNVATTGAFGSITSVNVISFGVGSLSIPSNPVGQISTSGSGAGATFNLTWHVASAVLADAGSGYLVAPTMTSSPAGATGTTTIGAASTGNPTIPIYFDQRLWFMGPVGNPQRFDASQVVSYYNFNYSDPIQADDALQGTLVSGQLNTIKCAIAMPNGLAVLSDRQAWIINGGSAGSPPSAINLAANAQAYNGSSDIPPIVANFDILYVQSKGSIVRDLTYNFYTNIYTGTDISVLSSHLFYGYTISGWAWAEEPFKTVWAVRNDGNLLSLTFLKEQELIGWAHSDTNGLFKSVTTVTETVSFGAVDATYTVVQRTINGNVIQYVERFAERLLTNGVAYAWNVDAGLQYNGAPATSFSGGEHLAGATVTGLADGLVITPFVMPTSGNFTLATAASVVTVGLVFTPQLQTLQLDLGEPTVQGKRKKIAAVTARCQDTLGLSIGKTFDTLVPMKDLVLGNVGSQTNEIVTGLVTGDARTVLDPSWDVPGQYCIQQSYPLPATILGVIPEIAMGDK